LENGPTEAELTDRFLRKFPGSISCAAAGESLSIHEAEEKIDEMY
jgi:hypothetical protein